MQNNDWLRAEDYAEPRCLLCDEPHGAEPKAKSVPLQRVLAKFDEYTSRDDPAGAERHMLYWLEEARLGGDLRGQFQIRNELMGLYRKTAQKDKAFASMESALALARELGIEEQTGGATAFLNAATVLCAFDEAERSLPLFEHARAVYEKNLPADDPRMGGLYNNMALTLTSLGRYGEADDLFRRALGVMAGAPNGALEQAITYLNMADTAYAQFGSEADGQINEYLETALGLLEDETLERNGYYAFVCEKCAPTFLFYGWTTYGEELQERARSIYERT